MVFSRCNWLKGVFGHLLLSFSLASKPEKVSARLGRGGVV